MPKKSSKSNKQIKGDDDEFVAPPVDNFDENRFLLIRKQAFVLTSGFIIAYLIILIVFSSNPGLMNTIVAWLCLFVWILPIYWIQLRIYKFSTHILEDQRIGKIYTLTAVYFVFFFLACLGGLIFSFKVQAPTLLTPILNWTFFVGLLPGYLIIYVTSSKFR